MTGIARSGRHPRVIEIVDIPVSRCMTDFAFIPARHMRTALPRRRRTVVTIEASR